MANKMMMMKDPVHLHENKTLLADGSTNTAAASATAYKHETTRLILDKSFRVCVL